MDGILLSEGRAYLEGNSVTGERKQFLYNMHEKEGSGLESAHGMHLGMLTQASSSHKFVSDLSFPEITSALKMFYLERGVLDTFPMIFDLDSELEFRVDMSQKYEEGLKIPAIYKSVLETLTEMFGRNYEKPLIPPDLYNYDLVVKTAAEAECPNLVRLLGECRKIGIL